MATWNTYVWVDSADETAARVRDAGGNVLMEPFDIMDAGRMAVFADPEGAVFMVWQAKEHRGARIVNEHGSLNFNDLNTRDLEGAKAFYGAVFGWRTLEIPGGFLGWTLPGYGDHLSRDNPALREQVAEVGGPEGFEDVVASIVPVPDDQPDTPAHWGVTFAVDDADAIAKAAAELGGRVIVPPLDAPWVRLTVITDPQGATFTASKFVIENKDLATRDAGVSAA
jgi:predicted enzyme related to lactoylglutathione lyase